MIRQKNYLCATFSGRFLYYSWTYTQSQLRLNVIFCADFSFISLQSCITITNFQVQSLCRRRPRNMALPPLLWITPAHNILLWLRPRYMRKGGLQPTKKAHITSYLDALRGWVAVIVLNPHHNPYHRTWILNQPFARILVHGRGMVDVFFVILGYVLNYRMLKLMRTRQAVPLLDTIVSSVFRRWIRLYGSAYVASFVAMLLVEFKWTRPGICQKTSASILWEWVVDFGRFSNIFASVEGYWY